MKNLLLSLTFLAIASPSWGLGVTAGQITTAKLANGSVTTPKLHIEALQDVTKAGAFSQIGVGVATPIGTNKLDVRNATGDGLFVRAGDGSDASFYVERGDGGLALLRVQADGLVGIGTASPTATLQVTTNTAVMKFSSISLGDEQSYAFETNFGKNGLVTLVSSTFGRTCTWSIDGSNNTVQVISDVSSICLETDTNGSIDLFSDADGTYTLKNRGGSADIYAISFVGFE